MLRSIISNRMHEIYGTVCIYNLSTKNQKKDFSVRMDEKSRIVISNITTIERSFIIVSMLKINLLIIIEFITRKNFSLRLDTK